MTEHAAVTTPRRGALGWALAGNGALWLLALPALLLGVALLVPVATIFTTALSEGTDHALSAVGEDLFVSAVKRTVVMAAIVTTITVAVAVCYALALALTDGFVRGLLFTCLLITFSISLLVRTYGWILLLQPIGALYQGLHALGLRDEPLDLVKTTPGMYPAMIHVMLPYAILPIYAALAAMDPALLRAARSLGASPTTILRRVVMPQLRPGIVAGATLVFVMSLGFFLTPRFLGGPADLTVATAIDRQFQELYDFAAASAMGLALLGGVLALYLLAERLFKVSEQWEKL